MQRLAPLDPPYDPEVARTLTRMMPPGQEPLKLFRTVAHNRHILDKLRSTGSYLLNFGTVDPADRELVIHEPALAVAASTSGVFMPRCSAPRWASLATGSPRP